MDKNKRMASLQKQQIRSKRERETNEMFKFCHNFIIVIYAMRTVSLMLCAFLQLLFLRDFTKHCKNIANSQCIQRPFFLIHCKNIAFELKLLHVMIKCWCPIISSNYIINHIADIACKHCTAKIAM